MNAVHYKQMPAFLNIIVIFQRITGLTVLFRGRIVEYKQCIGNTRKGDAMTNTVSIRLQDNDGLYLRIATITALVFIGMLIWLVPHTALQSNESMTVTDLQVNTLEDVQIINDQPAESIKTIRPPADDIIEDDIADPDATIADNTGLNVDRTIIDLTITEPAVYEIRPTIISKPPLEYPAMAQQAGLEGTVWVMVTIDTTGTVVKAVIQRSVSESLDQAALKAAWGTKFKPMNDSGKIVPARFLLKYIFQLH